MRIPSTATFPTGLPQAAVAIVFGLALALVIAQLSVFWASGAVLAVAFLALVLHRPDLGLLAALLVRSSTDLSFWFLGGALVHPSAGALPNTGMVLILIVAGGLFILSRGVPLLRLPGGTLFALLLLTGFIGMLRAESVLRSFSEWLPVVSGLVVYALAAHLFRSHRQVQSVIGVLAASFVVPAIMGFYQLVTVQGLVDPNVGRRIFATFYHPNAFGLYLVLIFSVFLCQALVHRGRRRLIPLLIVAATGPLLVGTLTRVAWVGAIVALLIAGILRSRVLLVLAPILLLLVIGTVPTIGTRFADPLGGSFADRVDIWRALLAQWLDVTGSDAGAVTAAVRRLTGLGPGVVDVLTAPGRGGVGFAAHNDYLRVLVEYGLFGLGAFLALHVVLLIFAFRTWKQARDGPMAAVALSFVTLAVAYPVMSLTENVFAATQNQMYFWAIAGLTVAAGRLSAPTASPASSAYPHTRDSEAEHSLDA